MPFTEGVDGLNLRRTNKTSLQIKSDRHGILGTWWIRQEIVEVLLQRSQRWRAGQLIQREWQSRWYRLAYPPMVGPLPWRGVHEEAGM
jgi:hypothetical protein